MAKRMELRLAKILRHVPADDFINIDKLTLITSKAQGIPHETAQEYISELIATKYLTYYSTLDVCRGTTPYPPELTSSGYYTLESECWSCGKIYTRDMDIYISKMTWDCLDCQVRWAEVIPE